MVNQQMKLRLLCRVLATYSRRAQGVDICMQDANTIPFPGLRLRKFLHAFRCSWHVRYTHVRVEPSKGRHTLECVVHTLAFFQTVLESFQTRSRPCLLCHRAGLRCFGRQAETVFTFLPKLCFTWPYINIQCSWVGTLFVSYWNIKRKNT